MHPVDLAEYPRLIGHRLNAVPATGCAVNLNRRHRRSWRRQKVIGHPNFAAAKSKECRSKVQCIGSRKADLARESAKKMSCDTPKTAMLEIAELYEHLAEQRNKRGGLNGSG